jgi:S-DNA-T family DNA segregation ATPase FtsK/SpoIIIE
VIHGLLPAARKGLVEFYAIDPKSAEAPMAAGMFRQIATTPDEWDEMLEMLVADLKIRQHARFGVSRESKVSIDTPIRVLLIDELANLTVLDTDPARRKRVDLNLRIILTQGRSELNMVIAAVQSPQKEIIGQTRQGFPMRVALRTADAGETDMVLGAGATERGALAHLIPVANKGNGNVSAGVGYMVLEEPDSDEPSRPVKVRFPYTSDDDLMDWSAEFLALFPDNCKPASEEEQEAALEAMRASAPSKSSQKKDERIIFPKPDQSIYNLWDQRYVPPVVPVAVELSNPDLADQAADFQFGALDDDEEVAS